MQVDEELLREAHWHAENGRGQEAAELLASVLPEKAPAPEPTAEE